MRRAVLLVLAGILIAVIGIPLLVIAFFVPVSSSTGASGQPTPVITESGDVAERVRDEVARRLGLDPDSMTVAAVEARDWPDSCLGLGGPAESCLAAITPGYRIVLEGPAGQHIVRTNVDGTVYRIEGEDGEPAAPTDEPGAVANRMIDVVARDLGIDRDALAVVSVEAREWPDSCLGLGGPAESCLAELVLGYRVVLEGPEGQYVVRTDATGDIYRIEDGAGGAVSAAELVRFALAQRLNDESVRIVSEEARDWSDSCFGLGGPAESCLAAITPGYRVVLAAEDGEYVARTDAEGRTYRLESSPVRIPASPDFAWHGTLDTGCFDLALFANGNGVVAGCGQAPTAFALTERSDLAYLERVLAWQGVETDEGGERLTIRGTGDGAPGEHQVRAAGDWAKLIAQAAHAGRRGASWGLAMALQDHEDGECVAVHLQVYGVASPSACTADSNLDEVVLSEAQLAEMHEWLDRYAAFEQHEVRDGLESFLLFSGAGDEQPSADTQQAIRDWLAALHPDRG